MHTYMRGHVATRAAHEHCEQQCVLLHPDSDVLIPVIVKPKTLTAIYYSSEKTTQSNLHVTSTDCALTSD